MEKLRQIKCYSGRLTRWKGFVSQLVSLRNQPQGCCGSWGRSQRMVINKCVCEVTAEVSCRFRWIFSVFSFSVSVLDVMLAFLAIGTKLGSTLDRNKTNAYENVLVPPFVSSSCGSEEHAHCKTRRHFPHALRGVEAQTESSSRRMHWREGRPFSQHYASS